MNPERIFTVLEAPHFSEKASNGTADHQFTFKVGVDATKPEIKQAVEQLFKVDVESVQTVKVKGKQKRGMRGRSSKKDWKKAIVRIADGQDIDFEAV